MIKTKVCNTKIEALDKMEMELIHDESQVDSVDRFIKGLASYLKYLKEFKKEPRKKKISDGIVRGNLKNISGNYNIFTNKEN
jgi:hypothetical protein